MTLRGLRAIALGAAVWTGTLAAAESSESGPPLFLNPGARQATEPAVPPASLRFVSVDEFAPFTLYGEDGLPAGIHVDLARALCAELGVSGACTFQVMPFDEVAEALAEGRADAAMAGIIPTAGNRERLLFSEPYARLPSRFIDAAQAAAQGAKPGETGVVGGTVHEAMAAALFPDLALKRFPDEAALRAALKAGTIAGAFGDGFSLGLWAASADASGCCALRPGGYFLPRLRPDALSVAVSAGRPDLLLAINSALRSIAVSGRLNEIYVRRLPFDPLD